MPTEPDQERVVLLAPVGRDASLLKAALRQAAFACQVVAEAQELHLELRETAGALLLTEEALTPPVLQILQAFLATQATWSTLRTRRATVGRVMTAPAARSAFRFAGERAR